MRPFRSDWTVYSQALKNANPEFTECLLKLFYDKRHELFFAELSCDRLGIIPIGSFDPYSVKGLRGRLERRYINIPECLS